MFNLRKLKSYIFACGLSSFFLLIHPLLIVIVSRGRNLNKSGYLDGSSFIQILFLSIILFYLLSFYLKNGLGFTRMILFNSPLFFFLLYIVLCSISTFWSENPYLTFYRSIESFTFLLLIVTVIANLFQKYNLQDIISWTIFFAFWNLTVDILYHLKLTGQLPFSIPFLPSRLFFPLFIFIIFSFAKKTILKILTFLIIILGLSNKIFIGIALSFFSLAFGDFKNKIKFLGFIIFSIFLLFSFGVEDLLLNTIFYGRDSIGLTDSSGRNHVWSYLFKKGLESPLLGYGYVSGETLLLWMEFKRGVINAHNTILSAFLGTGLLGTLLICIFFVTTFLFLLREGFTLQKINDMVLSSLIMILIVSNSGPSIGGRVYGAWIPSIFLITFFITLKIYHRNEKKIT